MLEADHMVGDLLYALALSRTDFRVKSTRPEADIKLVI